jgi:hypothetical protein
MDAAKSVTANFSQNEYALTINTVGSGSVTTDKAAPYHLNDVVVLTAHADTGWSFSSWIGCTGTGNTCSVTMDAAKSVTANFSQDEYALTINTVGSGSVTTDKAAPYHLNDVVVLTAHADAGWSFSSWIGCTGTGNTCSVTMDAAKSVTANFSQDEAPVIIGQSTLTTPEDTALTILLSNLTVTDVDNTYPNGFTLTVLDGANYTFAGTTITPASNFNGILTVPVKVNDGTLDSNTFDLSVTVSAVNDAPIITEGDFINVNMSEDGSTTPFSLTLHAMDVDDSDTITWSIFASAGHGTASASGTGTSMDISYTPALHYIGSDSFVVQVSDGNGGTATITVNVTITAVEPTSFTKYLPIVFR